MGAGALGSAFGGMLADAGHDVTPIDRERHIKPIKRTRAQNHRDMVLARTCVEAHDFSFSEIPENIWLFGNLRGTYLPAKSSK
jgi:ketopantoate reductase